MKHSIEIGKEEIIEILAEKFNVQKKDIYHLDGTLFKINDVEVKITCSDKNEAKMLKIEKTSIIDRYNLIDTEKQDSDDDKYIRQISKKELIALGKSIMDLV